MSCMLSGWARWPRVPAAEVLNSDISLALNRFPQAWEKNRSHHLSRRTAELSIAWAKTKGGPGGDYGHGQRQNASSQCTPTAAARALPARTAEPHGHARRLRYLTVRRVRGPRQRAERQELHAAGGPGGRRRRHHDRRAGQAGRV